MVVDINTDITNSLSECYVNKDVLMLIASQKWWSWAGLMRTCKILKRDLAPLHKRMMYRSLRQVIKSPRSTVKYYYPNGKAYKAIYATYIPYNTECHLRTVVRYFYAETGHCVKEYIQYQSDRKNPKDTIMCGVGWYDGEKCLGGWWDDGKGYRNDDHAPTSRRVVESTLNTHGVKSFMMNYLPVDEM
jgi:hypothetical protein